MTKKAEELPKKDIALEIALDALREAANEAREMNIAEGAPNNDVTISCSDAMIILARFPSQELIEELGEALQAAHPIMFVGLMAAQKADAKEVIDRFQETLKAIDSALSKLEKWGAAK